MLNAANSHWYVLTSKPGEEERPYDSLIYEFDRGLKIE
jgi:hypothetical protein